MIGRFALSPNSADLPVTYNNEQTDKTLLELLADLQPRCILMDIGLTQSGAGNPIQLKNQYRQLIHDIREALLPISSAAHTHNNKDVLDTITEQYMRDEAAFHAQTADALHGLSTGLSEVSAQAHSHSNKAVLDNITQEMPEQ